MKNDSDAINTLISILRDTKDFSSLSENFAQTFPDTQKASLSKEIYDFAISKKYVGLLTESGIGHNEGFFSEFFSKIGKKILPEIIENEELTKVVNDYFSNTKDYIWLNKIPDKDLAKIFLSLKFPQTPAGQRYIKKEILNAIVVLAQKIASIGIEKEVVSKISEFDDLESPFIGLNRDTTILVEKMLKNPDMKKNDWDGDYRQVIVMMKQCDSQIKLLYSHKEKYGISLRMTILIRKLEKYLNRLENLLRWLASGSENEKAEISAKILKELVQTQNTKYSLKKHFASNLEFVSFKIVENTSKSGENYIASTPKEYWNLFGKALGGGVIVAFLCWYKTSIYFFKFPAFWTAFLYSLNYAGGFVMIHLLRLTLATKQPAMTASTIAESLSNNGKNPDWLNKTTKLLTRQIRSQFISLVGNAIIAFPVAVGIGWAYFYLTGTHIATVDKANTLINELNILKSPAIFHAAIAGVYLMLSGLVSGYYENLWVYHNFQKRLSRNPNLVKIFGTDRMKSFTAYLGRNIGGITGNIFLGIMLGSTSTFGKALGFPLDIRHITFASGNFGIAFEALNYQVEKSIIINSIAGIAMIGLINVLVSFGLSITIALLSRGTKFNEIKLLVSKLLRQFIFEGTTFFYPSQKISKNEELKPRK
ncbi:MAG: site-specific recombinase [Bacteroidetes bacterium]|nr:site-specific recombinase [Bacteroidota bacterium]